MKIVALMAPHLGDTGFGVAEAGEVVAQLFGRGIEMRQGEPMDLDKKRGTTVQQVAGAFQDLVFGPLHIDLDQRGQTVFPG